MVKQAVVYPYHGLLLSDKKEQTVDNVTAWMDLMGITPSEKASLKRSHTT